jgi:hypothetical protein
VKSSKAAEHGRELMRLKEVPTVPQFVTLLDGEDFAKRARYTGGASSTDITCLGNFDNRLLTMLYNMCHGTAFRYTWLRPLV